jgi:hypothetical protein
VELEAEPHSALRFIAGAAAHPKPTAAAQSCSRMIDRSPNGVGALGREEEL